MDNQPQSQPQTGKKQLSIFIKKNDQVVIDVYAWAEDDDLNATSDEKEVPKNVDSAEIVKFTFRRPNNADSTKIMGAASISTETGVATNVMGFQDEAIRTLLIEIKSGDNTTQVRPRDINNLHPALARAAVAGLLERVSI